MIDIRRMAEADLNDADELRALAGWNQTLADWRQLMSFEPDGCFVAVENGRVTGTVTTTTYGRAMAWIGMMLVHPEERRRGIGTQLMHAALNYLQNREIECIRLDATPAGRPLYEKLGFVAEWIIVRHQATSPVIQERSVNARKLVEADWLAVERLDAGAFGVGRGALLRTLADASRKVVVTPVEGACIGYGMLRPGSQCDYLGPLVCKKSAAATSLVSALLRRSQAAGVFWDVPQENHVAMEVAGRFGFRPVRVLTRMRFGPHAIKSDPQAHLGIADPSLG